MDEKLNDLIAKAATIEMTEEDKEAQRQSFAYGNANIENANVTKEVIEEAARRVVQR